MGYYGLSNVYGRDVYFSYSEKNTFDEFDFEEGNVYPLNDKLFYEVDKFDSYLKKYDILPTMEGELVSLKLKQLIERLGSDCQFIPAVIISAESGEINESFFVMNVLNVVPCLDMEESEYRPLIKSLPNGPINLISVKYVPNSLNGHHIVRMKECIENIVVDDIFIKACKEEKVKGIMFVKEGSTQRPEFVDL
ncbi:imm11 family protein [Solibacillus sp. FSL K6-1523]|uniref:imm11 family protein n=1 Tax=Solibacillus sp. FSL K6-1523 TaxID=2921471 RepID=UPI0030F569F6